MKNFNLIAVGLLIGIALAAGAGTIIAQTSTTTTTGTVPCTMPNSTSTSPMSMMNNGHLAVTNVDIPKNNLNLGDTSTTLTANLISKDGANANNVTVHVQLLNSSGGVIQEAVFPGVDILHENPRPFWLTTPPTMVPGSLTFAVRVDNSDQGVNSWFNNLGTLVIGSGSMSTTTATTTPTSTTTPTTSTSTNQTSTTTNSNMSSTTASTTNM